MLNYSSALPTLAQPSRLALAAADNAKAQFVHVRVLTPRPPPSALIDAAATWRDSDAPFYLLAAPSTQRNDAHTWQLDLVLGLSALGGDTPLNGTLHFPDADDVRLNAQA